MLSFYKKYYKTVFDIGLIALTVYLFMLIFSYLYKIATPIFFALVIFAAIEPLARFLHRKGMKKSLASAISTLLFVLVILGVLVGLGLIFTNQISNLLEKLPAYQLILQREIDANADRIQGSINDLPPDLLDKAREFSSNIITYTTRAASWFLSNLFVWVSSFSSFMINVGIGIILAYFLSIEIDLWKKIAKQKTPNTFKKAFFFLKDNVLAGIAGYLKSQLKLISITFAVIFIALLILGVKNAFSISLLSAFFDLLPLLGVSAVFIPWIIYLFIMGETVLAISLTVLLGVVLLVRQIMEPKITGDTLGVSAFTMLSFMMISLSIFGVAGLILSPILIITLKALYEQGYLKQWIRLPEDEYKL